MKKRLFILAVFFAVGTALFLSPHVYAQSAEALDYRMRGYKMQKSGDLGQALQLYQRAVAVDPQYAAPYNDMGVVYEMQGQLDQAEAAYVRAITIDPNYAGVYSNLAALYEKRGDIAKAIAYWQKRASLGAANDPWVQKAQQNVIRLQRGAMPSTPSTPQYSGPSMPSYNVPVSSTYAPSPINDVTRQQALQLAQAMEAEQARSAMRPMVPLTNYGYGYAPSMQSSGPVVSSNDLERQKKIERKEYRKMISSARRDIDEYRYQDALDTLYTAKKLATEEDKVKYLDELVDEARSRSMDYELSRASMNADLHKKAKLVEVENYWYAPVPEVETIEGYGETFGAAAKSSARLELERKARQIIPSINFTEARLKEVIEFLAVSNDINIVIDETVVPKNETVTIHLKEIPLEEALDIILRTKGLKYRFEENIVWITTEEKLLEEDLVVRVYDVQDLVGKIFDFPSEPFDFRANLELGNEVE